MGWYHISLLKTESMSGFKKRVGNDQNGIFNPEMDSYPNWKWAYAEAVTVDGQAKKPNSSHPYIT